MEMKSSLMARRESSAGSPPRRPMRSEAAERADFSGIRYAQCWEGADVLLAELEPGPIKRCLSVASLGDHTLTLLCRDPERLLSLYLMPALGASTGLRLAAYTV